VTTSEQLLASHPDAAWLPEGGRAEVVLAGAGDEVPTPVCLVRLALTRDGRVLTVPRAGGGLDLPTEPVHRGDHAVALATLTDRVLGGEHPTSFLGFVRNVVPDAPDDYPWPSPEAHFAVWRCRLRDGLEPSGAWLDAPSAAAELGSRHWWPLVAQLPELRG
jgi:hypothetical protein